ncbi:MAG: hypothetical protein IPK64_15000 [bacterium]|nr:hypothetical protein [bacterium]
MSTTRLLAVPLLLVSLLALAGCGSRDIAGLDVARARIEPLVFDDAYGDDVYFQAFSGTYLNAVSLDSLQAHTGTKSLKVVVPGRDSPLGAYAGGVLTTVGARDFADFNALTFYAKSSVVSTLNEVGFGNDNTGTSVYSAGRANIALNPSWTFVVVPIPSPRKIVAERGMFTIAEGYEALNPTGHTLWFDEIKYANLLNVTRVSANMPSVNKQYLIGSTATIEGTTTTFSIDGANVVVNHMPTYFDFFSSNPAIARVEGNQIRVIGAGIDTITAKLDTLAVGGRVIITSFVAPPSAAPVPTVPAADVISLYSDSYVNRPVTSFNPHWGGSTTQNETYLIGGNANIMYTALNFVGIDFATQKIDISGMTHLHLDVFAPVGTLLRVKLVAMAATGTAVLQQPELTFNATTVPSFAAGGWSALEIPMADFAFTVPVDNIGQLVLSTTDAPLVLVDNIYWHR